MNKQNLLLICAYLSAFHMFQVTTIENSIISATFEIPTTYHLKKDVNENQRSLSSCFINYNSHKIMCSPSGPLLAYSFCATYNEDTKILSLIKCLYFQPNVYHITNSDYVQLPRNLSQLNDYMCGPLNRKGLVWSECADGFGPSMEAHTT